MPKAKPSQVILHRIELSTTEREMLEQYLQNDTIASYADVGKTLVIPVSIGLVVLAAYLIADGIWDFATGQLGRFDALVKQYEEETGNSGDIAYSINPLLKLYALATGK